MGWLTRFGRRMLMLLRRRQFGADLAEEMRLHQELCEQEQVKQGASPEEAHYAAQRRFGNRLALIDKSREMWGWSWLETFLQDARYGLRQLRRNPGFTAVAVITLALGIGANTAMFSVIYEVLVKPLPYPQPNRIIWVARTQPPFPPHWELPFSGPNYLDLARLNHSFQYMAAMFYGDFSLTGHGEPQRVIGEQVTADFFRVLGIQPVVGRSFLPGEDQAGHELEAVLSYGFWQRKFGGSRDIVGKTLNLNEQTYTVVGVMPRGFDYPSDADEMWVPMVVPKTNRGDNSYRAIGRLKPRVTLAQARADMSAIARRLAAEYPKSNDREGVMLVSLHERLGQFIRPTLLILFAAVGLLLLIACANVANLLLARGATRQREIAVRAALGARRRRLIRQMLAESVLLALIGGLAALVVGYWSIELLRTLKPNDLPNLAQIGVNLPVLWFTLGLSVLTGIIFGVVPAFRISGAQVNDALKSGAGGRGGVERGRTRSILVVVQFSLSIVLLVAAGLMIRSFARYVGVDPGFDSHHLLRFGVTAPESKYAGVGRLEQFYRAALDRIRALPGVESAATSYPLPPAGGESDGGFYVEGHKPALPSGEHDAIWHLITPGYFHTMRTPILRGRSFTLYDMEKRRPVIIINETLARQFLRHQDPIGRRLYVEAGGGNFATIIGVAADQAYAGWDQIYSNEVYFPSARLPWMSFVVRTKMAPSALGPEVRKAIWSLDKDLPIVDMTTMDQALDRAYGPRRFNMALLLAFAALGLSLAAVGIYGVVSYHVLQRTHEIGIRMALGARKRDVLQHVLGQGMILALVGVGIGIGAALGLTRFLASLLYGVKPTDPITFIAVSLILVAVALLACYIPARRAAKVDPMVALRYE
ncbi:MAG TPA: ABC transporter permease [Terriglobia bacterium]|nr:ABC transporter permease [Terriglobia bacterium]